MIGELVVFGVLIVGMLALMLAVPNTRKSHGSMSALAAHSLTISPGINYSINPYRVGAYVYVMEDSVPSQHDWQGTYIGMADGMAMVRDQDSHVVAHVNKDQLYGATR